MASLTVVEGPDLDAYLEIGEKQVYIGRRDKNEFILTDTNASRLHAWISYEHHRHELYDAQSTNGTFVNDAQVLRKYVVPTDRVRLGDASEWLVSEILKYNNDYSAEFELLKRVYDDYVDAKVKIQSANQFKTRLLQSLPFAIPGIVGVIVGFLGKGSMTWFSVSLLITVCAPMIGIYLGAKQSARTPAQLQALANQFKIDYVCPKCGTFLGEVPWESLRNRKQCPACKAKWVSE